jgi:hypothetical protein
MFRYIELASNYEIVLRKKTSTALVGGNRCSSPVTFAVLAALCEAIVRSVTVSRDAGYFRIKPVGNTD